ncbi:MAG: hypothetical protein AB1775_00975 [Bacteroidota bacterium]
MYICIINQHGEFKLHTNMRNDFNLFKQLNEEYKDKTTVGLIEPN